MSDTRDRLSRLLTRTVWILFDEQDGTAREVAPDTPGALDFQIRRVDAGSISVMGLRAALDDHELLRYARQAASQASHDNDEAQEDGPPPMPDDPLPEDVTMRAVARAVGLHAVLTAGMEAPTYEQARPMIHGTALENALYRAMLHWSPEVADPKTPAGS